VTVAFIDAHREAYGVEPICAVLPVAPSTYYEATARKVDPDRRPARARRDEVLKAEIGWVWRASSSLRSDLALDALEQAICDRPRGQAEELVHHSDRGVPYLCIRYTERRAEAGIELPVGSKGDSYVNAMAESVIGLFKTEVIRRRGPWRTLEDVEFATLEWVAWFNHRRLMGPIGDLPPVEYEEAYYRHHENLETIVSVT
jgi:transposase InsO family protein